jgi:hypothetical protein
MSWVATAVVAVAAIGSAVYSADQNRKLAHQQADALKASQEQDAKDAAAADQGAAVAANQAIADKKRRRRQSSLGVDPASSALGGAPTALGGAASTVRAPSVPVGTSYGGSAIGSAAPASAPASATPYGGGGGGGGGRYTTLPY